MCPADFRVEHGLRHRRGKIEVRKGLEADDVFVVDPSGALTTGTPVTVTEAKPDAAPIASARP